MKEEGVIEEYAIARGMALVFWAEPVPTYDLDVLVFLRTEERAIVSLDPIYDWTTKRGYVADAEHVVIEGTPVQFIPAFNALSDEAVQSAETVRYLSVSAASSDPNT